MNLPSDNLKLRREKIGIPVIIMLMLVMCFMFLLEVVMSNTVLICY